MDPAPIEGATRTLAEDQDEYLALQIRDEDFHGQPCMTSAWRPTEAELAALNQGAAVALSILGNVHPPVMLHVAPMQEDRQMTKTYYGTKKIHAIPMTRQEYNDYRGWELPSDENGSDAGYLVEYADGGPSNHPDHAGYISWSPKEVFDAHYQPDGEMSFGHALVAMQEGHKVARAGWNGKGMWIAYTPGSSFAAEHAKLGHAAYHRAAECELPETPINLLPHVDMRAADGSMVVGWLASQTDMLANDWMIVAD